MKTTLLILFLLTLLPASTITGFTFSGNRRTQESTLLRIARLEKGMEIRDSLLTLASKRLMKSDLFVSADISHNDSGSVNIGVNEKWTIIPYFNMSLTSEIKSAKMGLYDINFLGTNTTLGGQYHYFTGTHNGTIYGTKKDIGPYRLKLNGNLTLQKGINIWYTPTGAAEAKFIIDRRSASVKAELPLRNEDLFLGLSFGAHYDTIMEELGKIDFTGDNRENGYSFSGENNTFAPGLSLRYSGFKYHPFTYSGWGASANLLHGFQTEESGYNSFSVSAQWYKRLALESNLCVNLGGAVTDGTDLTSYLYIGGLNGVRGFNNGEFRGRAFVKGNLEYRIPSLNTKWLVFQHIFFMDYAAIADRPSTFNEATSLYGSGVGIRILSPKVYSFMIRFDYGWGWGPYRRRQYYLGTSHYFLPF